jgi:ankyrin repeat protein
LRGSHMSKLKDILGAVYRKDFSALERLSPAEVNLRDQDGRTPLMHAVLADDADPAIVKLLIERGADVNLVDVDQKWSALHFAARDQKEAIVRALLEAGADVDKLNVFGNTPLWESVMFASPKLAVAKTLLEHGADPSKKNHDGLAPIDVAARPELVVLFEGKE